MDVARLEFRGVDTARGKIRIRAASLTPSSIDLLVINFNEGPQRLRHANYYKYWVVRHQRLLLCGSDGQRRDDSAKPGFKVP